MSLLRRALATTAVVGLALAGALVAAAPASAIGGVVDNANDDNLPGSLRYEIENSSAGDTITFGPLFSAAQTITLNGAAYGLIDISHTLTIVGPGSGLLTVTRGTDVTNYDMFAINGSATTDVVMSGMTITGSDNGTVGEGSAVYVFDDDTRDLTFTDMIFSNQNAPQGAGVNVQSTSGDLSFFGCEFRNNDATNDGGGLYVTNANDILFDDTLVYGNRANGGNGGGVAINPFDGDETLSGLVTMRNGTRFEINDADNAGGGAYVHGVAGVTVIDTSFDDNTADNTAGGLYVANVKDDLAITSSVFTENGASHGGALRFESTTANIASTRFENNEAGSGGAIGVGMTAGYDEVTITDSVFLSNEAQNGYGGAIFTDGSIEEPFTIARTSFIENSAADEEGDDAHGGAIYVNGVEYAFTIDSSTFTRNATDGVGVSVSVDDISDLEQSLFFIVNSTFDEDLTAASGSSMIDVGENRGVVSIKYSTLVGFQPVWVGDDPGNAAVASTIIQSGVGQSDLFGADDPFDVEYSILSKPREPLNVDDFGNNQFSTNALLGPLQNNGGLTETRLPASNSPALNRGGPTLGAPLFDQRFTGFPRIVGILDVGAVEVPAALAATGSTVPLWMSVTAGLVLLLGAGALMFSMRSRRRTL